MTHKAWSYTDLSMRKSLFLRIGNTDYEVAQYASSWAVNEIPSAQCLLGIGRLPSFTIPQPQAAIHSAAAYLQMTPAEVWFEPTGEVRPDGTTWPRGARVIFRGYLTGLAYRKSLGKVTVVASLVHWLADLACSSCLTKNGHVANSTLLNAAAVLLAPNTAGAGQGAYVSGLVPGQITGGVVSSDLWRAMKSIFAYLADVATTPLGPAGTCTGAGSYVRNDRALKALARIEGPIVLAPAPPPPAPDLVDPLLRACNVPYHWGAALQLDTSGSPIIENGIAWALGTETIYSYTSSFWDKMVGQFFPQFCMAIAPLVESAVVFADTPCYRTNFWQTIPPEEYDSIDVTGTLERPLRAVGVTSNWVTDVGAGIGRDGITLLGGCYTEDSVSEADGLIRFIPEPPWLRATATERARDPGGSTGIVSGPLPATGTTPAAPRPVIGGGTISTNSLRTLYNNYAHAVYLNEVLRGRSGNLSSMLRFDVAPGSVIRIKPSLEVHLRGEDKLSVNQYACVTRVTITINAEQPSAGTTFQLTHTRTQQENTVDRTSTVKHPLFTLNSIHGGGLHGCPLLDAYTFK